MRNQAADETQEQVDSVVRQVSSIVSKMAGIQLGERQAPMVESRLRSRMVRLELEFFADYLVHLNENAESETQALISLLTTHHTFFFREFAHFELLLNQGLPQLILRARERGDRKIRIWSAASSRGQEVYSLAMFMKFHLAATAPDLDFEIWGTDIDPESIKWAKNGVYKAEELKQAPAMYVEGNWTRGTGEVKDFTKVKDHLKAKCSFQTANLLSCQNFLKDKKFDVIFCRNVFIYFDPQQIKQCSKSFLDHLDVDGWLFLGVSESLNGSGLNVQSLGLSVYRHPPRPQNKGSVRPQPMVMVQKEVVRKVLCVDDSPTIIALLKKILIPQSGFEVVGTAKNGLEAMALLKTTKVDVITLDLHMPEMDGIGFLTNYKDRQIPIIIVSAINRDDMSIAQKALSLGASDYIEKPSLENIAQASNEIRAKLKTILSVSKKSLTPVLTSPSLSVVEKKRVLIVDDSATVRQLLEKIISADPKLLVVGKAELPSQVEDLIRKTNPDVITMDIHMPEMDGVTLLKKIFPKFKIPTVMISSISKAEGPQVLQALEFGAVDYVQKPEMSSLAHVGPQICERIFTAATSQTRVSSSKRKAKSFLKVSRQTLVLLGASTGGTEAIREVLESLPSQIPPILIVQHIPGGFSTAFAKRLNELMPFEVREAVDGDEVKENLVLVAPGGLQMGVEARNGKLIVRVLEGGHQYRHKPSVDNLMMSVARLDLKEVIAVLMTGMGADGSRGMKELRNKGARTIAQDKASCVVYGMPREAIEIGAAEFIKPLNEIAETVVQLVDASMKSKAKAS